MNYFRDHPMRSPRIRHISRGASTGVAGKGGEMMIVKVTRSENCYGIFHIT